MIVAPSPWGPYRFHRVRASAAQPIQFAEHADRVRHHVRVPRRMLGPAVRQRFVRDNQLRHQQKKHEADVHQQLHRHQRIVPPTDVHQLAVDLAQMIHAIGQLAEPLQPLMCGGVRLLLLLRCRRLRCRLRHQFGHQLDQPLEIESHHPGAHIQPVHRHALQQIAEQAQRQGGRLEAKAGLVVFAQRGHIEHTDGAVQRQQCAARQIRGHHTNGTAVSESPAPKAGAADQGERLAAGVQVLDQTPPITAVHRKCGGHQHVATADQDDVHARCGGQRQAVIVDVQHDVADGQTGRIEQMRPCGGEAQRAPIETVRCVAADFVRDKNRTGQQFEMGALVFVHFRYGWLLVWTV